jgi:hypothetical protein
MSDLSHISTQELEQELKKRNDKQVQWCPTCGKWTTYMGISRSWREELHCHGCRKPVSNCTC